MSNFKEVDQRSDKDLIIRCNCGSDHFVTFEVSHDKLDDGSPIFDATGEKAKTGWKDFYVCFIEHQEMDYLRHRIKDALKYVFKRKHAKLCSRGIGITGKDMLNIIKLFDEYIAL